MLCRSQPFQRRLSEGGSSGVSPPSRASHAPISRHRGQCVLPTGAACPRSQEYAAHCANTVAAQAAVPESLVDHSCFAELQEALADDACTTHTPGRMLPSRASVEGG